MPLSCGYLSSMYVWNASNYHLLVKRNKISTSMCSLTLKIFVVALYFRWVTYLMYHLYVKVYIFWTRTRKPVQIHTKIPPQLLFSLRFIEIFKTCSYIYLLKCWVSIISIRLFIKYIEMIFQYIRVKPFELYKQLIVN